MEKYKTRREHLAAVAVKNHKNGLNNPYAQYHLNINIDDVLKSTMVADPLRLLDCSPITDGGAAVILCDLETAKKISKKPLVQIIGIGHATDTIALHSRKDFTTINATVNAARQAYKMADIKPGDVNVAEVHDCFTIAEVVVSEDLGFFEKGEGGCAVADGRTEIEGEIPINPSGGLKSKGHPVGATGVAQVIEIVKQLRGEADKRQVKNARIGLTQNMGGSGGSTIVHILKGEL
jgi:acetyl-CoA C-acetyltransferase